MLQEAWRRLEEHAVRGECSKGARGACAPFGEGASPKESFHFASNLCLNCCLRSAAEGRLEGLSFAAIAFSAVSWRVSAACWSLRFCSCILARLDGAVDGAQARIASSDLAMRFGAMAGVGRGGGTQAGEGRNLGRSEESRSMRVMLFPFRVIASEG